jgi:hypothetical protein
MMRTPKINWMKFAAAFAPLTPYGVFVGPDGAIYGPDGALLVPADEKSSPQRAPQPAVRRVPRLA